jgi:predicted kinase
LILVAGLPGAGKSTLARGLAERAGFDVIRSDVVRKELANLPSDAPSSLDVHGPIYTPAWNQRTYAECMRQAEQFIRDGRRVIVDATFREEQRRREFLDAAVRWGVPADILICETRPETAQSRLAKRKGDVSDADWAVHRELAESWEAPGPATVRAMHAISNDGSAEDTLAQALAILRDLGL